MQILLRVNLVSIYVYFNIINFIYGYIETDISIY